MRPPAAGTTAPPRYLVAVDFADAGGWPGVLGRLIAGEPLGADVAELVMGEVLDPGYHCIMEIWWNSREDFENSQRVIADPNRLPSILEDEAKLFATHSNPTCSVVEYDSPMGPNGETPRVELVYED